MSRINYIDLPANTSCAAWYALGTGARYIYGGEYASYGLPMSGLIVQYTQDNQEYTQDKNLAQMLFANDGFYYRRIQNNAFTSWTKIV